MNNEKCKYCDYVSKCSRLCEYGSYLCCLNRSFPKVVDKSYEELQKEVEKLQHYKTLYQSLKKQKDIEIEQLKEQLESSIGIVKHNMIIQKHVDRERKLQKKIEAKEENSRYERENRKYKETIENLKDKLMKYFEVGRDSYFYVLTRDKSAFNYGTMSFDDFKEFNEEQIDDIIDFLKEVI